MANTDRQKVNEWANRLAAYSLPLDLGYIKKGYREVIEYPDGNLKVFQVLNLKGSWVSPSYRVATVEVTELVNGEVGTVETWELEVLALDSRLRQERLQIFG